MIRRDFIKKGAAGATAVVATGCSTFGRKIYIQRDQVADVDFTVTKSKPKGGTIRMG